MGLIQFRASEPGVGVGGQVRKASGWRVAQRGARGPRWSKDDACMGEAARAAVYHGDLKPE